MERISREVLDLYNKDKYNIEYLDRIAPYIPMELIDLYYSTLLLSNKSVYEDEFIDSYEIVLGLLNKSLGLVLRENRLLYKEDLNE